MLPAWRQFEFWHRQTIPVCCLGALAGILAFGCSERRSDTVSKPPAVSRTEGQWVSSDRQFHDNSVNQALLANESPEPPIDPTVQSGDVDSELEGDGMRLFLGDRVDSANAGAAAQYTEAQLNKNFTLMMLASQPDIRARILVKYARNVLTEQQRVEAVKLALEDDYQFAKLKRRRAEILENALDGQPVHRQLRKIEEETVDVSNQIRAKFHNQILTQKQRAHLKAEGEIAAEKPVEIAAEKHP